jgi:predicted nucleotidyltransferase
MIKKGLNGDCLVVKTMNKLEINKYLEDIKNKVVPEISPEKIYLFGSFAKNTNQADSDIDVAIIVKSLKDDYFTTNPLLWKLRREIDDRIEPVLFEQDFDDSGFLAEIENNGICII